MQPKLLRALVALAVAIVALSSITILIRLSEADLGFRATIFNRLWLSMLIYGLWSVVGHRLLQDKDEVDHPEITKPPLLQSIGLLCFSGLCLAMTQLLWAWSLTQTNVATAAVLASTTPLFTILGGWIVFGDRFGYRFLSGLGIAVVGAASLGVMDFTVATDKVPGDTAALGSVFFYSAYLLTTGQLRPYLDTVSILFWNCVIATGIALPVALIAGENLFPVSSQGWLILAGLAILGQGLGYGLLIYSLNWLSAGFVTLCLLIEPVLTATEAWIFFAEQLSVLNIAAFGTVLLGVYLALSSTSGLKPSEEADSEPS